MNIKNISFLIIFCVVLLGGCATTYESACHELASESKSDLRTMIKKTENGSFKRHLILLETGTLVSSNCRSHFIDKNTFDGIPESLTNLCNRQGGLNSKYCTLYQLDSEVLKERVH